MISEKKFAELMSCVPFYKSDCYDKFSFYCEQLKEWNENVNLTAITDDGEIAIKHFCDSVLPLSLVDFQNGADLIDVGTGAGFPSIPMKIVRDDINITLLDPLEKRLVFLEHICDGVGIDAEMVHLRAEQAGKDDELRESYDIATTRAVANMALIAEYCLPLVKLGGMVVALKGSSGREEVEQAKRAIELCGGEVESITDYKLPNADPRILVVLRKISPTPDKYPRNSAQISKRTL